MWRNFGKKKGYGPIFILQMLIQLRFVIDRGDSSGELLVLPGVDCCDPTRPHGEQRHWPWKRTVRKLIKST